MPVKPVILSEELLSELRVEADENNMEVDNNACNNHDVISDENPEFLQMEKRLCDLVQGGNLHWRHHQMAIGMLLTMMVSDHKPPENVVNMWMECLLHDDITIRFIAFQVNFQKNFVIAKS